MEFVKKNILLIIVFGLIVLIIISIVVLGLGKKKPLPSGSPIPSASAVIQKPETGKKYQIITGADQKQIDQDSLVGNLLTKLPYKGTNFSLDYSYNSLQFILTLNTQNKDLGNKEFDQFLLQNQILDRSWLKYLTIK
ncbi:hypothetical protein HYW46_06830 [Candidatus Daviesbacteria bacterium]|nr:hypothetical protein [Candidatus Daviesbacteria bacterium]